MGRWGDGEMGRETHFRFEIPDFKLQIERAFNSEIPAYRQAGAFHDWRAILR